MELFKKQTATGRLSNRRANIAKVESRNKVYFGYAETKAYMCAKHKLAKS